MDEYEKVSEEVSNTVADARKSFRLLIDKADAMDRLLEAARMTWDQYRQLPGALKIEETL